MGTLIEYLQEEQPVARWKVFFHFLMGVFGGACLMFIFAIAGIAG